MEKHFKKVSSGNLVLAAILGLFALTSCTRAVENKASVKIEFPSNMQSLGGASALGFDQLRHLIINVSGPGISPQIYFSWDGKNSVLPPPSFGISVPAGDSRLVQVLAVYGSATSGDMQFFYGDQPSISTQQDSDVAVVVKPIIAAGAIGEGQIAGRYLDQVGSGPTGILTIKFNPPGGRQAMVIEHSEMFGGYFRTFALENAAFDFVLDNGTSIFGGPVTTKHGFQTTPATGEGNLNNGHTMQVSMNTYFQSRGGGTYESRDAGTMVFGWFGDVTAIGSKAICSTNSPSNASINNAYTDGTGTIQLAWGLGANVTASGGFYMGRPEDSEKLCFMSTGSRFADYLSLDHSSLGEHDRVLAFQGPYRLRYNTSGGGQSREGMTVTLGASTLHVKYDYLPGAVTTAARSALDGSDIFWRANLTSSTSGGNEDYRTNDGYACGHLGDFGFKLLKSEPAGLTDTAAPASLSEDVTINTADAAYAGFDLAFNEGRAEIVACPYALGSLGKRYFKTGINYRSYSGGMPATQIIVSKVIGDPATGLKIANDVCTPLRIRGANGWLQNPTFNFSSTDATVSFYSDSYCGSPASATPLMWSGDGLVFYTKRASPASGISAPTLTITDASGTPTISSYSATLDFNDYTPTLKALALSPPSIKKYSCYPLSVLMIDDSNSLDRMVAKLALFGSDTHAEFVWPTSDINLEYFANDPSCSGTPTIPSNSFMSMGQSMAMPLFFRYIGSASTISITPGLGSFMDSRNNTLPVVVTAMGVTSPGVPKRLSPMIPMNILMNTCQDFNLQLQDMNGNVSPPTVAFSATLGASGGAAFYDPGMSVCSCSAGLVTGPIPFAVGQTQKRLCYKAPSTPGPNTISITATHGTTNVGMTMPVNIN